MLSGCSERAPGPAADMLRSGLNALKQKDYAGFQKYFLPEQQGNTYYEYWTKPFFNKIEGFAFERGSDRDVRRNSAKILAVFKFEGGYFSPFFFQLRRIDGKWHIDWDGTVLYRYETKRMNAWKVTKYARKGGG